MSLPTTCSGEAIESSEKAVREPGRLANHLRIILFTTFIYRLFLSSFASWVTDHNKVSVLEKRPYAAFPHLKLSPESIRAFPAGFEAFFSDRFPLRLQMVALSNLVKWKVFGVSGSDKVLVGKDDWLFYLDGGNTEFLRHDKMEIDKLKIFVSMFESRRAWLARHHIKYLLVFVPCKCEMYRDKVPERFKIQNGLSMQDQLVEALRRYSGVQVIDLRQHILSEKKRLGMPLYLESDSHWNQLGAFVAYQSVVDYLAKIFPAIKPVNWGDVKIAFVQQCGGDLAGMLGLRDQTSETAIRVENEHRTWALSANPAPPDLDNPTQFFHPFATEVPDVHLPKAYFIRDSFTINMQPFLSEHFRRAFYHWNYFRKADDDFLPEEILKEKPDIVIQEMAENLIARDVIPNPNQLETTSPDPFCLSSNAVLSEKIKTE